MLYKIADNDARLVLRKKLNGAINDMVESKLKAKKCNRGQLFRPCWASQHGVVSYEVISWLTDIHKPTVGQWARIWI